MNKEEIFEFMMNIPRTRGSRPIYAFRMKYPVEHDMIESLVGVKLTAKVLFDYLKPDCQKNCLTCGAVTKFERFYRGYPRFCGTACSHGHEETKRRRVSTCLAKYGEENPSQFSGVKQKKVETCRKNLGVDFPSQSSEARAKSVSTWKKNFGEENPLQNAAILRRAQDSGFKRKVFLYKGVEFSLQGYEPQALHYLAENVGLDINLISVPDFNVPYRLNGKSRRYYPDFIVGKTCIEVKSTYTAGLDKLGHTSEELRAKAYGVLSSGMEYMLMIMDKCGSLISWSSDGVVLNKSPLVGNNFEGRP